jgi:protein dithiol:quinone oxidoreductase
MADRWMAHAPRLLVWLGLLCWASLGVALVAQHAFDVRPCPWCVLQRGVVMLLALFALLGGGLAWWLKHRQHLYRAHLVARLAAIPVVLLAMGGLLAATYQHEVAAQSESCAQTLADRIVQRLDLETSWPAVFMITANCQDAGKYRLIGLPYEIWSGLLFALALGIGLIALLRGARL